MFRRGLGCLRYITYLLTYAMMQSPSWAANWFAVSQEIPAFHGTRRFITALTSVRHLSLSWPSPIQSIYPHPTSWRSVLISTHLPLGLPSGLFPSSSPPRPYTPLTSTIRDTCPAHHHISLLGSEALIRRCDDWPTTITHVPVAAVQVFKYSWLWALAPETCRVTLQK